jgi:hypothetical protein
MNESMDLTPPGKPAKAPKSMAEFKGEGKPKKERKPKAEATPKDPNAPAKPRAPRVDYGYRPDATIQILPITAEEAHKYRGKRLEWFEKFKAFDGKTVKEFEDANGADEKDPPRGWVRFFVQDGAAKLIAPATVQ